MQIVGQIAPFSNLLQISQDRVIEDEAEKTILYQTYEVICLEGISICWVEDMYDAMQIWYTGYIY